MAGRPNGEAAVGQQSPHTKIVQGAMDTIARDKISGTRMREIARRSGISQGHLHYYFSAKSTLFLAVLDHLRETFAAERRAALHDTSLSPGDKLAIRFGQKVVVVQVEEIKENPRKEEAASLYRVIGEVPVITVKSIANGMARSVTSD